MTFVFESTQVIGCQTKLPLQKNEHWPQCSLPAAEPSLGPYKPALQDLPTPPVTDAAVPVLVQKIRGVLVGLSAGPVFNPGLGRPSFLFLSLLISFVIFLLQSINRKFSRELEECCT